jgi:hypothetical protein
MLTSFPDMFEFTMWTKTKMMLSYEKSYHKDQKGPVEGEDEEEEQRDLDSIYCQLYTVD